jgi:hypothetical protein
MEEVKGEFIKEIPNFSRYLADVENGKIYRKPTEKKSGKWLKNTPNAVGYCYVRLTNDDGRSVTVSVHSVIMSAAIESLPSFWLKMNLEIDHRNRKKHDNRFANLHLKTKKQNHENIERISISKRLSNEDVEYIHEEFSKWEGRKIEFYKLMAEQIGCVWQTIQYHLLGYRTVSK